MSLTSSQAQLKDELEYPYFAGEYQAVNLDSNEDALLCKEIFDSYFPVSNTIPYHVPSPGCVRDTSNAPSAERSESDVIPELDNIELDTPPDFQLAVSLSLYLSCIT